MRAIGPHQPGTGGAGKAPGLSLRAVEKTSASSALGQERPDSETKREKTRAPPCVERLSHDGPSAFDPFWHAPRLVPAFVTQLLGQLMPARRESIRVETAYGRAGRPRTALLLDRKS